MFRMSTFYRPPFSYLLQIVLCSIWGLQAFIDEFSKKKIKELEDKIKEKEEELEHKIKEEQKSKFAKELLSYVSSISMPAKHQIFC